MDPKDTLDLLKKLEGPEFGDAEFWQVHHFHGALSTFRTYCHKVEAFQEDQNNHRLHRRLEYVLRAYEHGMHRSKSFAAIVGEAFTKHPKK